MLTAILGFGRFGQALSDLLVKAGHDVRAYDPNVVVPPGLAAASPADAVQGAQWVVLAMPVPHLRDALTALRPLLHAGQTVIDVGSVKLHTLYGEKASSSGANCTVAPPSRVTVNETIQSRR